MIYSYIFYLIEQAAYVAVALSEVDVMSPCSVMECINYNDNIEVFDSWMTSNPRAVTRENIVSINLIHIDLQK